MSFLFGKSGSQSNVNKATTNLQSKTANQLSGIDPISMLFGPHSYDQSVIKPILDYMTLQSQHNFSAAKESAGNLTGSGFANVLGRSATETSLGQGSQIADLMTRIRSGDQSAFLQLLSTTMNSPAAGVTQTYRPGLVDYAGQGATALASGGAFNGLFK